MAQESSALSPDDFARSLGGTVDTSDPDAFAAALGGSVTESATQSTQAPTTRELLLERLKKFQLAPGVNLDTAKGAVRGAVSTAQALAAPVRKAFGMAPATPPPEETTTEGKMGRFLEQGAEFLIPAAAVTKGAKLFRAGKAVTAGLEAAGQAATSYGISKAQGSSETGSRVNAAISAASPVASLALTKYAPVLRQKAIDQLSRVFARGVENKGPALDYALATGQAASPDIARSAAIVQRAAADTLDLPIQASWGKWQTVLGKDVGQKGQDIATALAGPFGDVPIPKKDILDALDALVSGSAQHFAQVSQGGYQYVTYNPAIVKEVEILKDSLAKYHDQISTRNLVDIKRVWDNAVYNLSTIGKVGVSPDILVSNAMKEAMYTGANGVRDALSTLNPTVEALDTAYSHARQLQDLVAKLYKAQPGVGEIGKQVAQHAGAIAGLGVGMETGHPFLGVGAGGTVGRMLASAIKSPLFQTAGPVLKGKLAAAITAGQVDVVRQLLAPFVEAGVSTATRQPSPAASAVAAP